MMEIQVPYVLGCFGSGYKYVVHVQKYQEIPKGYVGGSLTLNKTDFPEKLLLLIV